MVKYALMLLAVAAMFVSLDAAQARGRRGGCPGGVCHTGGCPGGVCAVPVAPVKTAAVPAEAAVAAASEPAPAVATAQPAPRYSYAPRRLFARRR